MQIIIFEYYAIVLLIVYVPECPIDFCLSLAERGELLDYLRKVSSNAPPCSAPLIVIPLCTLVLWYSTFYVHYTIIWWSMMCDSVYDL